MLWPHRLHAYIAHSYVFCTCNKEVEKWAGACLLLINCISVGCQWSGVLNGGVCPGQDMGYNPCCLWGEYLHNNNKQTNNASVCGWDLWHHGMTSFKWNKANILLSFSNTWWRYKALWHTCSKPLVLFCWVCSVHLSEELQKTENRIKFSSVVDLDIFYSGLKMKPLNPFVIYSY